MGDLIFYNNSYDRNLFIVDRQKASHTTFKIFRMCFSSREASLFEAKVCLSKNCRKCDS